MKMYNQLILCTSELVSFEVSTALKVIAVPVDPVALNSQIKKLVLKKVRARVVYINQNLKEIMTPSMLSDLKVISSDIEEYETIEYK